MSLVVQACCGLNEDLASRSTIMQLPKVSHGKSFARDLLFWNLRRRGQNFVLLPGAYLDIEVQSDLGAEIESLVHKMGIVRSMLDGVIVWGTERELTDIKSQYQAYTFWLLPGISNCSGLNRQPLIEDNGVSSSEDDRPDVRSLEAVLMNTHARFVVSFHNYLPTDKRGAYRLDNMPVGKALFWVAKAFGYHVWLSPDGVVIVGDWDEKYVAAQHMPREGKPEKKGGE